MRIRELRLLAFGPFRDKTLRFDGDGGLEIVFGPNEAGKSTTRRAVLGLLYGIPVRSKDGHSVQDEVRVGALLEDERGRVLDLVRRKGAKNTLLQNEQPLDEQVLTGLLGGVDAETYELAYGLDHAGLRHGGDALRVGKGELGESLFAAATGLTGLHGVLADLRAKADALFRPRGGPKYPLNQALHDYDAAKKNVGQLATTPETWLAQEKQIADARGELDELRAERADALQRREAARAIAVAARDFAAARARLAEIDEELAATRAELDALDVPTELLARAQAIADLQERLGSHREGQLERPRVAVKLEEIEERARRAERDAPHAERRDVPAEAHVRRLVRDAGNLAVVTRQIEEREAEQAIALARAEQRLAALGPASDAQTLHDALDAARRDGDLEARVALESEKARRERLGAETLARSLRGFEGTLEELVALPLPPREAVAAYAREARALTEARRAIAERRRELELERADADRALATLRGQGDVPTEEALARARAERDAIWSAVRETGKAPSAAAAGRFERAIRGADELADRLRREAGRTSRLVEISANVDAIARKLEILAAEERERDAEGASQRRGWDALWTASGVTGEPEEMSEWLERHDRAASAARRALDAEKDSAVLGAALERARSSLREALLREGVDAAPDASLAKLEQAAKRLIAARDKSDKERAAVESTRAAAELERDRVASQRAACDRDRAAWSSQWAACTRALGLSEGASPEEVTASLEAIERLARIEDDRDKTSGQLAAIDREGLRFADDVRAIAAACAPDLASRTPEDACAELVRRRSAGDVIRARRETLEEQRRRLEAQREAAGVAVQERSAAQDQSAPAAEALARELDEMIVGLDDRIQQTSRHLGGLEGGAKQFDQSPAVDHAADAQRELARVRDLAEEYARVRLAGAAVARLLERFSRENQGPVLARASEIFSVLTLGSFEGIEVGFGESDDAVLLAVRESRRLETSALSEGTADQLYLALRVASLERLTAARGPLPLLLDDVLVHFDDQRAAAALAVLGELAKRTQVILFTHHARVVEIARRTVSDRDGGASAAVHELTSP